MNESKGGCYRTFDNALKIELSLEVADKNAQDQQNNSTAVACHKLHNSGTADSRVNRVKEMQASASSKLQMQGNKSHFA